MRLRRSKSLENLRTNERYVSIPSKPPSQLKDWQALNHDIGEAFLVEFLKLQQYGQTGKVDRHDSIYNSISGIAFMQHHLAGMQLPLHNECLSPKRLLRSADKSLARVLRHNPINPQYMYFPERLSFLEANIGIAVLVLIRGLVTTEQTIVDNWYAAKDYIVYAVQQTLAADHDAYSPGDKDDGCEVLYGRAGMLYALMYLRKALHNVQRVPQALRNDFAQLYDVTSDTTIQKLVDSIISRGKHGAYVMASEYRVQDVDRLPPLMWSWHGKRYIGGAHGIAGILQIILLVPEAIIRKHLSDIFKTIYMLTEIQDEAGNWPSKYPAQNIVNPENELVQWCHGAPGMIILLSTALKFLKSHGDVIQTEPQTLALSLERGAELVYRRGLLKKGVGLCHGVAGSVFALLAASDVLDGSAPPPPSMAVNPPTTATSDIPRHINHFKFFSRAAHLAFLAKFHDDATIFPDASTHDRSLYEGLAGACCAWAEVLCRMDTKDPRRSSSGMPGYDDL